MDNQPDSLINQINIRDEAYRILRRRILSQEYPPGYRFNLPELETQLGVSRTPIKEALQRLESEGLVNIRSRRGTFVVRIDPQEVEDSWDVRRVLETYAASEAADRVSPDDLSELKAMVDDMQTLFRSDDLSTVVEQIITLDHTFHLRLVSLAGNRRLTEIYEMLSPFVQLVYAQQTFDRSDLALAQAEHEAMLRALENGDKENLERAVASHIDLSKQRLLNRSRRH